MKPNTMTQAVTAFRLSTACSLGATAGLALAVFALAPLPLDAHPGHASTFREWIALYPGLKGPDRLPTADPDRDGLPNAGEKAHGTDPELPSFPGGGDPQWRNAPRLGGDALSGATFDFALEHNAVWPHGDIEAIMQSSTNFDEWLSSNLQLSPRGGPTTTFRVPIIPDDPTVPPPPRLFHRVKYKMHPTDLYGLLPTFNARAESELGGLLAFDAAGDDWRLINSQGKWVRLSSYPRSMAANFVTYGSNVPIAVTFTAETRVPVPNKRLFVRARIDGKSMDPGDVVLARGTNTDAVASRSFEFTGLVDEGIHTVEIEVLMDREGQGFVRDASLLIRQGDEHTSLGKLQVYTPPSGPNLEKTAAVWEDVPGLGGTIVTENGEGVVANVSAESYTIGGGTMRLRVLLDGVVMPPGEVRFVEGPFLGTRTMSFTQPVVAPGAHNVEVQWFAENGGVGLGDRTLTLAPLRDGDPDSLQTLGISRDDPIQTDSLWKIMEGMSVAIDTPDNAEVAVRFSGEINEGDGPVSVRLKVDGQVVAPDEVQLQEGSGDGGAFSFVFSAKHVNVGSAGFTSCTLEWKDDGTAKSTLADRSMVIHIKPADVPDLSSPPGLALGNVGIEPAFGERNVLAILWDPDRPGHPAPGIADLSNALFGLNPSVRDYYSKVSDGRLTIKSAGVLGPYRADKPADHYWDPHPACGAPGNDGYTGGHQEKWFEALTKADADFDFSDYDFDGDGRLDPMNELAVIIVIPQTTMFGTVRLLDPHCAGGLASFDGVEIHPISEWYSSYPLHQMAGAAHELAHLLLNLPDIYRKSNSSAMHGFMPGRLGMMAELDIISGGNGDPDKIHIPHFIAPFKLALGWIFPRLVLETGDYYLDDIKDSARAVVLPRLPGIEEDEYYVLENRQEEISNLFYDTALQDSGIAVWHVIEGSDYNGNRPNSCVDNASWTAQAGLNSGIDNARRGLRLVRPTTTYNSAQSLWSADDYDLDAFGLTCPSHNILTWADGTASYRLEDWSPNGDNMSVRVVTP